MLTRTLASLAGALALSGALASTASAGTLNVKLRVQGAGAVVASVGQISNPPCTQELGVSEQSERTCPEWGVENRLGDVVADLGAIAKPGWQFVRWEGCESASGHACSVSARGNDTKYWSPKAIFEDIAGPDVLYPSAGKSKTEERTLTGSWLANEPNVTWKCSTDTVNFVDCASPYSVQLPEGGYSLTVYGVDVNGNVGPRSKVGPVTLIDTALTVGPAPGATVTTPASAWVAKTGNGTAFECSLDDRPYEHCGTPDTDGTAPLTVPAVADGTHTLRVRARRGADLDPIPATRTWTVDTTPRTPVPTATPQPPAPGTTPPSNSAAPITVVQRIFTPIAAPAHVSEKAAPFGVKYRFRKGRFTKLTVHGIPAGTKLAVTLKRPGKRSVKTTLKRLVGKRLKPGTKITLRAGTAKKTITIRHRRAPRVR